MEIPTNVHALRLTQSRLEAYFSFLRGLDSNSKITGATLKQRISIGNMHTYFQKFGSTKNANYDETDLPEEDEEVIMYSTPIDEALTESTVVVTLEKNHSLLTKTVYECLFEKRQL